MTSIWYFLRRFAWPYKTNMILSIVFNFLTALMTLFSFAFIIPILKMLFGMESRHYDYMALGDGKLQDVLINDFNWYVQSIIESRGPSVALAVLSLILIVMTGLKVGTAYLGEFFVIPMRNGVVRDIRNQMYRKILELPIGFFSQEKKGDIMARISGDVTEVENSVMASIQSIFAYPVMIIACLGMMLFISWRLTLFVLILLPLMGWVMGTVGKKLKAKSLLVQTIWGNILATVEETIGGLRVVKAFNGEKQMDNRFERQTNAFYRNSNQMHRRQVLAHPMSEFLGTIAVAMVLWFGGSLILSGDSHIDAPEFIYYMVIFYSIINPAKDLAKVSYTIQKGSASLMRIDKILGAVNPIQDPESPAQLREHPAGGKAAIEFRDVTFGYTSDHDVLKDINLKVGEGQRVALVGQSGSGKSTMVDLIPRFWDVDKGAVLINGTDVRDLKAKDLRSLMGNVNQEAILFNDTFFNNIAFGAEGATMEEVERAARIANAHDFIMETQDGYNTLVGDRGCLLSGGQRQRISIARSILKNPPILILDEATSALDTESERLVQEALERLMENRTTVVVAHRLSTIVNADIICVIDNGQIVEQGTHDELLALNGHYARLVSLQNVDAPVEA
ncbi:MAG: ABC transporter ATP-binding protein [Bacteroides sp.]|nr:ABC transporter ATP-binding protein [Bacteroides sp.]MBD5336019.1 ABC transporter ATP-binding protein [Bacteroides sp.]